MIKETNLHYKILEKLGEGGMGVVYLAEDTKLKRKVAIKFLPHHISANDEERKRFEIEAQAAAALNHPNIATIYAIEESDGQMFIVMEYIDGIELKDKIKSGHIPTCEVINIAIQIAEGLEAAHEKEIVHRDIKSQNIMITSDGKVKIMDFGLAKVRGDTQLTKVGSTVGTAAYMSPEQAKGEEVDHRTDIWSFGIVLYEMVTGKMPFKGEYDQAVVYSILNEEPEPDNEIDEGLKYIISKALKKEPEVRYQSAGEIAKELSLISQGGEARRTKTKQSKLTWIVAGTAVIVIAIALYLFMPSLKNGTTTETIRTIAVLPFDDLSPKKDQGYFSDGLSEEFINVLSKNPKLRVIAKTSSFSFRGKGFDIKTIAAKLSVKNILEGSVRKAGNKLRISADLVNAKTDATLWSNTYDGTLNNIFALQDSISDNVAEALKVELLGKEAAATEQKTDPEAYNDYLLGKHFYNLRGKENFVKAEEYYKKAISIDSGYAPAWVGLSFVHVYQANYSFLSTEEGFRLARNEAKKAIELNPELADGYATLAWIKTIYDWDWKGADKAYKKAKELEPENINVLKGIANLYATIGRIDEAIKLIKQATKIDPVNLAEYFNLGFYNWEAGLHDESIAAYRKCLELNPQDPVSHMFIALNNLDKGKQDSILTEIEKEQHSAWQTFGLAIVYHALGKKKDSDDKLTELIKKYQSGAAYQISEVYAYRNEKNKAFEWLEKAFKQKDGGCITIKCDPLMHNLVKDPRYTEFLKKMKLPQ